MGMGYAEEGGEHNSKMGLYVMHANERPCCIDGHGGCQGGGKHNSRMGCREFHANERPCCIDRYGGCRGRGGWDAGKFMQMKGNAA